VTLAAGTVEGFLPPAGPSSRNWGAAFKAIPFAQPPVGPLRWHAPVAVQPWTGVKAAKAFAPACAQEGRNPGSEDCLYLNVWTPEWPARGPHPVMLWLYGGANSGGSASRDAIDGSALARRGIIVVTAGYRVGVMGFMAHPALAAESGHNSSGNYALLDQIAALSWIKDNIVKFGGDPRNVTLAGQSSGAYDLLLLMTSPLAKGLFAHAIAESGQILSYGGSMPKARAEAIGVTIASALKAPDGAAAISYLRGLPADQVIAAGSKVLPTDLGSDTGLLTNVDGWVLPELPARVFAQGREMAIPLIVGNNAREITPQITADALKAQIAAKYGDLAPKALAAYGLSGSGAEDGARPDDPLLGGAGAQWMTDTVQRCAAIMEADWHAAARQPTFAYQFERPVPGREAAGSTHGAEIPFVFGNLDPATPDAAPYSAADRAASEQVQGYWTRFMATGDPNGAGLPAWPRAGAGRYMAFTVAAGPVARSGLQAAPCGVFREWTLKRLGQ
jgi:para-nitrobenzyl esterase